jgi:hypothetical protein
LEAPKGSDTLQDFMARAMMAFSRAELIHGFIDRSGYRGGVVDDRPVWGEKVDPRFFKPGEHADSLATLSLWRDLESVSAFIYHGIHADALQHRREKTGLLRLNGLPMSRWWVPDDHLPTWQEGVS